MAIIKLIGFLVAVAVFLCLVGFNLDNKSDVSFAFYVFKDVPVFMTMFCSFCAGVLFTLPFVLKARFGRFSKRNSGAPYSERPKMPKKKHVLKEVTAEPQNPLATELVDGDGVSQ